MKIVEFKDVSLSYDGKNMVLDHISFDINSGEIISIIGANGVGKSSIAKLIIGLVEKTSGSIKVFDLDVDDKNIREIRKQCGLVFQNPDNQFIGNTVAEDVAFRLENSQIEHSKMDSIVDAKLKEVDMYSFKTFEPTLLSGGQKQRVAIASNIVLPLKLLIFDESTSMIDPKGKEEVMKTILKVKEENKDITIVIITHNMEEVLLTQRVLVVDNHQVAFDGKPESLFTNYNLLTKLQLNEPFKFKLVRELKEQGFAADYNDSYEVLAGKICQSK